MKSPSTLIKKHEKAICCLDMMQKAQQRTDMYKSRLKMWRDRHHMQSVHNWYRCEQEIIDEVITANRVYCRIKNYYLNLLKTL